MGQTVAVRLGPGGLRWVVVLAECHLRWRRCTVSGGASRVKRSSGAVKPLWAMTIGGTYQRVRHSQCMAIGISQRFSMGSPHLRGLTMWPIRER